MGFDVYCSRCGLLHRFVDGLPKSAKCADCRENLLLPNSSTYGSQSISRSEPFLKFLAIIGLLGVIFIPVALSSTNFSNGHSSNQHDADLQSVPEQENNEETQPLEASPFPRGIMTPPRGRPVAPLSITTSNSGKYYAKLVDSAGYDVMSMTFLGGERVEWKVPLGKYTLKYAYGQDWYGFTDLFGPETLYFSSDSVLEFDVTETTNGYQYNGFDIELELRPHGNFSTSQINARAF